MLERLHIKNVALIEECEISFGGGLNILTGETGAGKSMVIDSLHFALGGRVGKDFLRRFCRGSFSCGKCFFTGKADGKRH